MYEFKPAEWIEARTALDARNAIPELVEVAGPSVGYPTLSCPVCVYSVDASLTVFFGFAGEVREWRLDFPIDDADPGGAIRFSQWLTDQLLKSFGAPSVEFVDWPQALDFDRGLMLHSAWNLANGWTLKAVADHDKPIWPTPQKTRSAIVARQRTELL